MTRRWLAWLLIGLGLGLAPQPASAAGVDLRTTACTARLAEDAGDAAVIGARYRCGANAPTHGDGWLWLRLDAARLAGLAPGWTLMVDQTRFQEIAVVTVGADGVRRRARAPSELRNHWAPGGLLTFPMDRAGRDVHGLYLGFRAIDDLSLMRKIVAAPAPVAAAAKARWLLLMGVFAGTMLSAFFYNAVIHAGQRYAFQRWYVLWVAVSLAYGLTWTNMAAFLMPGLVGPVAVRVDFVLVGLMVAAGNMFFFALVEDGILPRALIRLGRLLAAAGAVLGGLAAMDQWFPPVATDRLLNCVIAATAIAVAISCGFAIRRGSRVIWFYMAGWGPVICVFLVRLARNFGLMPQKDAVDMATFGALAFEALVLSLAIADRFRRLRQELALARQRREVDVAETRALRHAAHTDFLTGLGNRAAFQAGAQALIARDAPFSLFLLDVDYLKDANDRLGHAGGDALLCRIGAALSLAAEPLPDVQVARIGGDEFAILCPGDAAAGAALAERLAQLQGKAWQHAGQQRVLSLSIGSASFPADAQALDLLYQNADLALYTAKRLGRARHQRYDPLQRNLRTMQMQFTGDAEGALARGEFRMHMQPIVTLTSGEVCGYEALLRWDHPAQGLMAPDRFADVLVAETIGVRIQEHVLELALTWLRARKDAGVLLSVNFTSAQLAGPNAARHVLDRLAHHGVAPESLCVEVTETVLLDRAAEAIHTTLRVLRDAGVRVALDAFGTGSASLLHLRTMPFDRLKIDRLFVAGLDQPNGGTLPIVRAIVGVAQGLGKLIVAQGIETEAQARRLRDLGCQLGQGFLFGEPEPQPQRG